jgi:murein DD-endopeptidase MepM/ murein hydrolase activator NlpD
VYIQGTNAKAILCITVVFLIFMMFQSKELTASNSTILPQPADLVAPISAKLKYPFTKNASIKCGRWNSMSQDYPYFGAPRDRNTRKHAGIDIYPAHGEGTPVKAIKAGKVIKVAPFYTRANGEVTYGVLIEHGDFVANYAELKRPVVRPETLVKKGQEIGRISGTKQLHFEQYTTGTKDWLRWYGDCPSNLLDPTQIMVVILADR